jgi:hypothetical protein
MHPDMASTDVDTDVAEVDGGLSTEEAWVPVLDIVHQVIGRQLGQPPRVG